MDITYMMLDVSIIIIGDTFLGIFLIIINCLVVMSFSVTCYTLHLVTVSCYCPWKISGKSFTSPCMFANTGAERYLVPHDAAIAEI